MAAAFLVPAGGAGAQQADTAHVSASVWTACPGARVRIATRAAETITGRCGPVADGRLLVRAPAGDRQIQLADVDSLWTRKSYVMEATVLLALVGAATGALTAGEEKRCEESPCTVQYEFGTAERAGSGAVAGAGLGLLIGRAARSSDDRAPTLRCVLRTHHT